VIATPERVTDVWYEPEGGGSAPSCGLASALLHDSELLPRVAAHISVLVYTFLQAFLFV
jgi:hypothetical protein